MKCKLFSSRELTWFFIVSAMMENHDGMLQNSWNSFNFVKILSAPNTHTPKSNISLNHHYYTQGQDRSWALQRKRPFCHRCIFLHSTDRRFSISSLHNNWKLSLSSIHHLAGSRPVHPSRQLLLFAISLQRQEAGWLPRRKRFFENAQEKAALAILIDPFFLFQEPSPSCFMYKVSLVKLPLSYLAHKLVLLFCRSYFGC